MRKLLLGMWVRISEQIRQKIMHLGHPIQFKAVA
jgi:hypothetical protein